MTYKIYGLKIYTKTIMDGRIPKMIGVVEGPVNKMIKAYPEEFSFMRHETKRDKKFSKGKKYAQQKRKSSI